MKEFIESEKNGQDFSNKATMMKARIQRNLERLKELIYEIENQESEIATEECEERHWDAEERILDLQVLLVNYIEKQQAKMQ